MEHLLDRGAWPDRLTRRVAFFGLLGLLSVSFAIMADVLLRWLFLAPIMGFEEVASLLYAVVVSTCFPAGLIQGHNITIRFLGKGLGPRSELWLETFGAILTLIFFVMIAWQMVDVAYDEMIHGRTTLTIHMSTAPWWWVVAAVMAICVPVQLMVATITFLRAATGRIPETAQHAEVPDFLQGLGIDMDALRSGREG